MCDYPGYFVEMKNLPIYRAFVPFPLNLCVMLHS